MEQLKKLLETDPADVFLHFGLAMEYRKAGQGEEAIAQFRKINELNPTYVPAYFMQGQTLLAMDRRDVARAILTRGIEVAQNNNDPHAAAEMTETLQAIG
jgi:tetratricopeptide (TPR) repeat protein